MSCWCAGMTEAHMASASIIHWWNVGWNPAQLFLFNKWKPGGSSSSAFIFFNIKGKPLKPAKYKKCYKILHYWVRLLRRFRVGAWLLDDNIQHPMAEIAHWGSKEVVWKKRWWKSSQIRRSCRDQRSGVARSIYWRRDVFCEKIINTKEMMKIPLSGRKMHWGNSGFPRWSWAAGLDQPNEINSGDCLSKTPWNMAEGDSVWPD